MLLKVCVDLFGRSCRVAWSLTLPSISPSLFPYCLHDTELRNMSAGPEAPTPRSPVILCGKHLWSGFSYLLTVRMM